MKSSNTLTANMESLTKATCLQAIQTRKCWEYHLVQQQEHDDGDDDDDGDDGDGERLLLLLLVLLSGDILES